MRITLERNVILPKPLPKAVRAVFRDAPPLGPEFDPGYVRYQRTAMRNGGFWVYFNGRVLPGADLTVVDEEHGIVERLKRDRNGRFITEGNNFKRERLTGTVKIVEYLPGGGDEAATPHGVRA
jgi:hypothetical protein